MPPKGRAVVASRHTHTHTHTHTHSEIQARCHLKAGLWLQEKDEQLNPQLFSTILHAYRNATQLDGKWYKACGRVQGLGFKGLVTILHAYRNATQLDGQW
jgi:hypothetical protein